LGSRHRQGYFALRAARSQDLCGTTSPEEKGRRNLKIQLAVLLDYYRSRTTALEKKELTTQSKRQPMPLVDANNASMGLIISEPVNGRLQSETKVSGSHYEITTIVAVIRFVLEGAISSCEP